MSCLLHTDWPTQCPPPLRKAFLIARGRNMTSISVPSVQYDMRNGAIRKKFDSLKYTLRKLETLLYELSLVKSGAPARSDAQDIQVTWGTPK